MKKIERVKTIQLFVFFILAIVCIVLILGSETYYLIADNKELQMLCTLLWMVLFTVFICIFIDFTMYSRQKNAFNALDYAVHSDPLAKIANRQGCDEIIEKYIDQSIPDGMGVVMILLESLNEINRYHTRLLGNKQIRSFSIILKLASTNVCFVGRNGGNVFMAIFEKDSEITMDTFLDRVEEKVREHNKDKDSLPMYYTLGKAIKSDPEDTINGLISKAHKLAREGKICPAGTVTIGERMGVAGTQKQKSERPAAVSAQSARTQRPAAAKRRPTTAEAPIAAIVPFKEDLKKEAKSVEAKAVETKPVKTKVAEAKPLETKPVETKATEAKPVESKPIETKAAEAKPVETKPVETKATEAKPVETKPIETKAAEAKPIETKPAAKAPTPITSVLEVRLRKGYSEAASKKPAPAAPAATAPVPAPAKIIEAPVAKISGSKNYDKSLSEKYDDIAQYDDYKYSDAEVRDAIDTSKMKAKRA